jgi:hypothetical protein
MVGLRFADLRSRPPELPLPTPEDRLPFTLASVKTSPSKWYRDTCSVWARAKSIGRFTACPRAVGGPADLGDTPARSLTVLASDLVSRRPMVVMSMTSALPTRLCIPYPYGAGSYRL